MQPEPIKILLRRDGQQRVVVIRRADGLYTFRYQWAAPNVNAPWGPMGPDCGVYDSVDTAETEAMLRTDWLNESFH
jgi:hypothetical protein